MANSIYAVVSPTNMVVNLVEWDGVTSYSVDPNTLVLATGQSNAQVGGTFIGGVFTAPAAPAVPQGIIFANSPSSGASIQLPDPINAQGGGGFRTLLVFLQPAVGLATLRLLMPLNPQDGDVLSIKSSQLITALSFSPTFNGAPATLAVGSKIVLTYSAQAGFWFVW